MSESHSIIHQRFEAAVRVIKNLPKEGSFQPSNELKLKLYAYFKQAKEGPCKEPKPSFWDVVKKAKWEAWTKLGEMGKEEAMEHYTEELKSVAKEIPRSEAVDAFFQELETTPENGSGSEIEIIDENEAREAIAETTTGGYLSDDYISADEEAEIVHQVEVDGQVSLLRKPETGTKSSTEQGDEAISVLTQVQQTVVEISQQLRELVQVVTSLRQKLNDMETSRQDSSNETRSRSFLWPGRTSPVTGFAILVLVFAIVRLFSKRK